jgi:EmrB/QacA subfamily drug resistance transporter
MAICSMSLFMVGMDVTIVNIALPSIQHDLHPGISGLEWVIDAYALLLGSLLILSGSTGDRLGRRRTFQIGIAIFTAGSLLCSVAPTASWLIGFRMVQGVGGSMLNPVSLSIIRNVFTDPRERARAMGVWAGVFGLSLAIGPLVGGLLIGASAGWRSIFWVNVPVGLATFALTARFGPESRAPRPRRIDPGGQALVVVMLASLTYAIIQGPQAGWMTPAILATFALSLLALAGIVIYEPRRREPLLELRFFASVPFSGATVIALCAFAAMGGFALMTTLYLQIARGYSALHAGLLFIPAAGAAVIFGPLSGRLVARFGARPSLFTAGVALALCAVMLSGLTPTTSIVWLVASYFIFGIGFGMVSTPINNTALAGMPPEQAGVAAGIVSSGRQVGQTLGVAIAGSLIASNLRGSLQSGLTTASHSSWFVITGYGVAVAVLALVTTSAWTRPTADRFAGAHPSERQASASSTVQD